MKQPSQWFIRLAIMVAIFTPCVLAATKPYTIEVNSPSAVLDVVQQIEQLSGFRVIYEDIRDDYFGDYEDIENLYPDYYKGTGRNALRTYVRKPAQLSVTFPVDAQNDGLNDFQSVREALLATISVYNANGPGAFDLESFDGVFFVKPTHMRDENGNTVPTQPILSTPITLTLHNSEDTEIMGWISRQISSAIGLSVRYRDPMWSYETHYTFSVSSEPASHAILKFLETMDTNGHTDPTRPFRTSYAVGYGPKFNDRISQGYAISIHMLSKPDPLLPRLSTPPPSAAPGTSARGRADVKRAVTPTGKPGIQ